MAQQTFNNLETLFDVRTIINDNANDAEARLTALEPSGPANSVVRQDGGGALEGFANFTYGISGDTTTFTMGVQAAGSASTLLTVNAFSEVQYLDDTGNLMTRFYRSGTDLFWEEGGAFELHVNGVRLINTGGGTNVLTDDGTYQPLPAGGTDENVAVSASDTTPGNLDVKVVGSNGVTYGILNGGGNEQIQLKNPAGGGARQWNFDGSSFAAGNPGSGNFRMNNVNQNMATALYMSKTAQPNGTMTDVLTALRVEDRILVETLAGAKWKIYRLTGTPTDDTTHVTIPVVVEANGPDLVDTDEASWGFMFTRGGAGSASVGAALEMNGSDGAGGWVGSDWLVNGDTLQPKTATPGTISSATDEDLFLLSAGAAGRLHIQGVGISKTAPTVGQVLTATSPTQAEWSAGASPSVGSLHTVNVTNGTGGWLASNISIAGETIQNIGGNANLVAVGGISINAQAGQLFLEGTSGVLTQNDFTVEPGAVPTLVINSTTQASVAASRILTWDGTQNLYVEGAGIDTSAVHVDLASEISAVTEKVTPVAGDLLLIEDSADSNNKKRIQIGSLPTAPVVTLQTAYDNGNAVITDAAGGDFDVSGTEAFTVNVTGNATLVSSSGFTTVNGQTGIGLTSAGGNINLTSTTGFGTFESDNVMTVRSNSGNLVLDGQVDLTAQAITGNLTMVSLAGFTTVNGDTGIGMTSANGNVNITSTTGFGTFESDNVATLRSNSNAAYVDGSTETGLLVGSTTALVVDAATIASHAANRVLADDGSGTGRLVFIAGSSALDLQGAYDNGSNIVTDAAGGDIAISGTEGFDVTVDDPINIVSNLSFLTLNGNSGIGLNAANGSINLTANLFGTLEAASTAKLLSTGAAAVVEGQTGISLVVGGVSWTWPTTDGTSGQAITTSGAGVLSFSDIPDPGGAPADVTKAAASAGASADFSRADHKHDISTAAATSIGNANAEGSATSLARSDHNHLINQFGGTVNAQNNDIDNVKTVTFNSVVDAGNMGVTETINWNDGQKQAGTNSANCTISFTDPPGPCNLTFKLTNGGAFTLTWPGSVEWPGGTEPTWTASGVDVISFFFDGTTYFAMAGLDFS